MLVTRQTIVPEVLESIWTYHSTEVLEVAANRQLVLWHRELVDPCTNLLLGCLRLEGYKVHLRGACLEGCGGS